MASLEYPQQITSVINTVGETVTVKFIYLVPSSSTTTTLPGKVQVTGTFNAWQRSQPLSCSHDQTFFEADVPIDLDSLTQDMATSVNNKEQQDSNQKKILFKFILDDQNWVIDQDQPTERDFAGNLNNVLFIDHPVAPITTSHPAIPRDDVPEPSTPVPAAAAVVKQVEIEDETEEERAARLKQEAEDDETIRQLGGGMWGAPYFAVNDPIALPDHFSEVNSTGVNNTEEVATASTSLKAESETVTHDIVAEHADAVEAAQLAEKVAQKVVLQAPPATEWDNVESKEVNEDIIEDEDDKVIKELGGGMWGTPFFKVNDPTTLPEHIQTALAINAAAATTFASSNIATTDVEEVADKDIRIVKDEIATTIEGSKLIETVVETTEDTIIEAADGTFLEESITTSVESSISGVIDEAITETIETIEEVEATPSTEIIIEDEGAIEFVETIEEQTDNENNKVPARVSTPEVTMTETETLTSVQGEDGLQTTIIEDTLTFSEGPEVDSSSLHSLTTAVKPVNEGESVIVEQSPEFMISVAGSASAGDAKPSVDESVEPLPLPSATATNTTVPTSAIDSTHSTEKCQQDDEVVLLQSQKPQENAIVGDAKPTADQSANTTVITSTLTSTPAPIVVTKSTLPNHLLSDAPPAALTVASPDVQKEGKTEKSEKRKSFWKKVKKVLS
ncbi:hypothetical protein FBU30_000445 [Linnemannia zychae]|nr:hypothetical protein FBU30_000445 [Linnemannia zychae]